MDLLELGEIVGRLGRADVARIASSQTCDSAGDEVDAWRATLAIDRELVRLGRRRDGARAASQAASAVQRAATDLGIPLPDHDVTQVARAAAELARAIVAGREVEEQLRQLLGHWAPLVALV
jgi:hypothetical protein